MFEKAYISPWLPLKVSLKHDWEREFGSEDGQRPDGGELRRPIHYWSSKWWWWYSGIWFKVGRNFIVSHLIKLRIRESQKLKTVLELYKTIPLSRCKLKSKGHEKLSIHYFTDQATIETIFRIIVSVNQLNLHGAIANICEECESFHDRSRQPDVFQDYHIPLWSTRRVPAF